jgi:creatinine amidohydrolase/Fe(II)-dependent formamide hydrolase-like protein
MPPDATFCTPPTWPQIDALNRDRTLFILPVGMVNEHGPHLPVGAAELSSFGMDVHAGVAETSGILAVRPDLVPITKRCRGEPDVLWTNCAQ